jgi:hypothetical protein
LEIAGLIGERYRPLESSGMQPDPTETARTTSRRRTPVSTYRLQFHRGFRFEMLRPETRDGQTSLPLASILSVCPVAVLRGVESGDAPVE